MAERLALVDQRKRTKVAQLELPSKQVRCLMKRKSIDL